MAGNTELYAARTDCIEIGVIEIFLTKMYEIAAFLYRQLPVVVDDELAVMCFANVTCCTDFCAQFCIILILDTQLHQLDAKWHHAFDPVCTVKDRVERIEGHYKNAFPIRGVEGAAISRASIGSAS